MDVHGHGAVVNGVGYSLLCALLGFVVEFSMVMVIVLDQVNSLFDYARACESTRCLRIYLNDLFICLLTIDVRQAYGMCTDVHLVK